MKKTIKLALFATLILINKNIIKAANYIWPIGEKNAYETYIEYGYGQRTYDSNKYNEKYNYGVFEELYVKTENHYGVDITGIKGNTYDIVSVVDGTVLTTSLDQLQNPRLNYTDRNKRNSSYDGGGYGNYIVIKEDSTGLCFLYAHLKANTITLRNGDKVSKGQKIGEMGSSGDSGHMHLHFEVRPNQEKTTPGKNLVVTRTYNVETLNPTDYIGDKSPEKEVTNTTNITPQEVEEPKTETKINENNQSLKETPKTEEPIIDNKKAKVTNIEYEQYSTFEKIIITLDKEIDYPEVDILIGSEGRYANFISKNKNKYTYTITYSDFDITSFGGINLAIRATDNIEHYHVNIGYLKEYKIPQTYEDSYYYKLGDLNKDGKIDSVDASQVRKLYSKLAVDIELTEEEKDQMQRADMNKDGYVNSIDASLILNYYSKMSTSWTGTKQEKIIACDFNGDHVVNFIDYSLITAAYKYAQYSNKYDAKYDLNMDGVVNVDDKEFYRQVLKEYGSR